MGTVDVIVISILSVTNIVNNIVIIIIIITNVINTIDASEDGLDRTKWKNYIQYNSGDPRSWKNPEENNNSNTNVINIITIVSS